MRSGIKDSGSETDMAHMEHGRRSPRRPSALDRVLAAVPGRRREVQYLVLVNTTRGPVAVPGPKLKTGRWR